MTEFKIPPGHENGAKGGSGDFSSRKFPEFVVLDAEEDSKQRQRDSKEKEFLDSIFRLKKQHYGFALRIFFVFLGLFFLIALALVSIATFVVFLFALLGLFQVGSFNAAFSRAWKSFRVVFASTLGMFVAVLDPAFGLGIVVLYLMLNGENVKDGMMSRIINIHSRSQN
jgi:ABC-type multidrug transport system fused ATPase/permease subunit